MSDFHWTDFLLADPRDTPEYIIERAEDDWECRCGNSSHSDGFQPCNEVGEVVEPNHDWTSGYYVCERCYRIIDSVTLQVMGRCGIDAVNTNNDFRFHN